MGRGEPPLELQFHPKTHQIRSHDKRPQSTILHFHANSSSDFVCEAVGHNLAARLEIKPSVLSAYVATESIDEDPFRLLAQWRDEADAVYDVLRY